MRSIRQAVILAGGQGMRMRPLTLTLPKPMIPIHNKPFLEYIIKLLKENGIKEIVILTGYLHEKIEDYFKDGKKFGLRIKYSFSPVEDETGTRIGKARELIDDEFLLLYSDNYWPLQLNQLFKCYKKMNTQGLVTVYSNIDNYTKNNILVDAKGLVEVYDKSRQTPGLNGVDIGFFILNKKVLNLFPQENFSFEKVIIPRLIKEKQMSGYLTNHKYYGLSNLGRIPMIEEYFKKKKVVFLDRDGVINKRPPKAHYITTWEEFVFLPKVKEALRILKKEGFLIFIVSNQPGIARGVLNQRQVDKINDKMCTELKKSNVKINGIYICPHGWDEGCFCRKPNPGLFFHAASEHRINLFGAFCVGDDSRDIVAGNLAGCKTIFIQNRDTKEDNFEDIKPDYISKDLYSAVQLLISK